MVDINVVKEVNELTQAFYLSFQNDVSPDSPLSIGDKILIRNRSLEEASKLVQAKLISTSLSKIAKSLKHTIFSNDEKDD